LGKKVARKRKHEEEHENLERWLVSYADFITLLFAFFVTMYAISRVDEQKLGSAVESLQRALGSLIPVNITQKDAGAFPLKPATPSVSVIARVEEESPLTEQGEFAKLAQELKAEVEGAKGELDSSRAAQLSQIKFLVDKRGLVIRVPESFFFYSGQASLRPEVIPILNVLGKSLAKIPNHVRIEGHTDSVPIHTPQFPSNWELSTARATTIVRHLLTHFQFNPQRLSATGYAEFHPIAPNTTADGRLQNRRVDMVILSTGEAETEPPEKVAAAAVPARASTPPAPQAFPRPGRKGN
jgi:chemotaxis protein MotB